jgi:hypothetical protein
MKITYNAKMKTSPKTTLSLQNNLMNTILPLTLALL